MRRAKRYRLDPVTVGIADEPGVVTVSVLRSQSRRTIGFGKAYPEFWLNLRATMAPINGDCGVHVGLRVRTAELVDAFHAAALAAGGTSDGAPGLRPQHGDGYYAGFIRDPDGNRVEAVTFLKADA